MILYSVIMFAVAALVLVMSAAIYKGKTDLIHSYHQTRVTDLSAYGKAFGKALAVFGAAPLCSGIIALLGDPGRSMPASMAVLFAGMIIGIGCILAVQRKYNGGLF